MEADLAWVPVRRRVRDPRVKVLVKVHFLDELEVELGSHLDEGVEGNEVLVDIEDVARHLLLANGISQVEVVLKAEGPIATAEVVLAKHDAEILVSNAQVVFAASLADFVDKTV